MRFDTLVKFFIRFSNLRGVKKANYAKMFLGIIFKNNRSPDFAYSIIRLMLPNDDKDRGNYGLK
jgi:DNA ligase-4